MLNGKITAKDGWSFAAIQEADGVLYVLTRNFYSEELPELRKFAPDTLSALEADTCTSEVIGLALCAVIFLRKRRRTL